jgi:hypothetical protein
MNLRYSRAMRHLVVLLYLPVLFAADLPGSRTRLE